MKGIRAKAHSFLQTLGNGTALKKIPVWANGLKAKTLDLAHVLGNEKVGKRLLIAILVTGGAGAAVYWTVSQASPEVEASTNFYELTRGSFTQKITKRGELRALESVTISAQKDLPIIYLAPEGTFAKKGDVLVRFDASKYEAQYEESQAAYRVAQAELRKAQTVLEGERQRLLADVARAEAEVRLAQLALDDLKKKPLPNELEAAQLSLDQAKMAFEFAKKRTEALPPLVQKGFVTQETQEEAELGFLTQKANLQSKEFFYKTVAAGATPTELDQAQIRLDQAKFSLSKIKEAMKNQLASAGADVDRQKANLERADKLSETALVKRGRGELEAPKDGLVVYASLGSQNLAEKVQLGMIPFEGQPIIYLPDLSTIVVDTQINEMDIGKVQVGGSVEVKPEAYSDEVFPGEILKIGALARFQQTISGTASGIKVFDVTVKVNANDPRLKPGLTAELDFLVDHREDVLTIPLSAVMAVGDDQIVRLQSDTGKIIDRTIVLGPSNNHIAVVTEGLDVGDRVLLNPTFSS